MLKQGLILLIAVIVGLSAASTNGAEQRYMYKWKGADGELHYTERPPKDIPYEKIRVRVDERAGAIAMKVKDKDSKGGLTKQDKDMQQADDSYQSWRKENCRIAQQNLDILENAGRIATDDGQGGKRLMTDEEKAANKEKAKAAVDKYCDKGTDK